MIKASILGYRIMKTNMAKRNVKPKSTSARPTVDHYEFLLVRAKRQHKQHMKLNTKITLRIQDKALSFSGSGFELTKTRSG